MEPRIPKGLRGRSSEVRIPKDLAERGLMTSNQRGVKARLTQEHGILGTAIPERSSWDGGGEFQDSRHSARHRSVECVLSCNSNEP